MGKNNAGLFVQEKIVSREAEAEVAGETPVPEVAQVAPRPDRCRSYARKRLAAALPKIADAFVEEAKKGSSTHLKTLMQLGGLDGREVAKPAKRKGKGTAGRLLEEWRKGSAE